MTTEDISLELEERTTLGKGLNHLRGSGKVPAVIHDHGKSSIHVAVDYGALSKAYAHAGKHHPIDLAVGNKKHLALIKDIDFEPSKHTLRHVVFQAIKQNEKVHAEVPVVLVGDSPAAMKSLLILQQVDVVEVAALPKDLPDQLEADITSLAEVGDKLHVSDLKVPGNVALVTDGELQLAIVEMPKDQIAEADAAAAELAADANQPVAEDEAPAPAASDEKAPDENE